MNSSPQVWLVAALLALLLLMRRTRAEEPAAPADYFDDYEPEDTGTRVMPWGEPSEYTLIRPEGERNEYGAYDQALYAKRGVDPSVTVYIRSLKDPDSFIPIRA